MKKRIISLLLILILCLSLLPTTALAAEKTVSTKDELNAALSGSADTIKLTKDISLSAPITVSRTVTIDLNGHNLINLSSPSSVIVIETSGNLTLTDSNSTATNSLPLAPTGGIIMGTTNQSDTGGGITVKGTLIMRGGTVFSSQANLPENSGGRAAGGIFIAEGGTALIFGGCISDCFTNGNRLYRCRRHLC